LGDALGECDVNPAQIILKILFFDVSHRKSRYDPIMTPDQLFTFAVVAAHKNISNAAQALHLSQPAVSGQLRLLRESFGEALYRREGKGIALTPAGAQLAEHAEQVRSAWVKAAALRDAFNGVEGGSLRIGATTTPASFLLPYLVRKFHARHPKVAIELRHGNTAQIVAELPHLDIALVEGPVSSDLGFDAGVHPWHEDQIVAIVPDGHPLLKRRGKASLATLARYPLVWREPGSGVRQIVEHAFAAAGVDVRIAIELAGVEGVKEAVRAGMGIGFVSAMAMRHGDPLLAILPTTASEQLRRRFNIIVMHGEAASLAARTFLALCGEDTFAAQPAGAQESPT